MPSPRKVAFRVKQYLSGLGFLGLRHTDYPARVEGIPFVVMKVTTLNTSHAQVDLGPDSGRVVVHWRVPKRGEDIENDEVRLRGVDFAPMLAAWVESERSKRHG